MNDVRDTLWLLIDDDVTFTQTLSRGRERQGDRVLIANTLTEAQTMLDEHPDRVLLDLRLGTDSGLQFLPELRTALPDARIVMLTGFASIATAIRAVKEGADDYLPKPVTLPDVLAAFSDEAVEDDFGSDPMSPRRLEWEHIQRVLEEENGNISQAARRLGMHRRTLQRKLAKRPAAH